MLLYLITQKDNVGYDVYTGAVVVADSEHTARHMHPGSSYNVSTNNGRKTPIQIWVPERHAWLYSDELTDPDAYSPDDWVPPSKVIVKLIGVAVGEPTRGVVLASWRSD